MPYNSSNRIIPTLFVKRLIVMKGDGFVYDQKFKLGVNIIRGDNGTGKSTVIDLLYYGLGAEITDWTAEQELCDEVIVEVMLNYKTLCLRREVTETGKAAMFMYDGSSEQALEDSKSWFRYPNMRNRDTHSYSQQLFELMGLPSHQTDESKNLTMHQILRLIYADQLTQTTKLLKEDKKFDNTTIRRAIGEYLLGIDDLEAHNLRQELIRANAAFDALQSELKAIYKFLGSDNSLVTKENIRADIASRNLTIIELKNKRDNIRQKSIEVLSDEVKKRANKISSELETLTETTIALEERTSILSSEVVDSKLFLDSLMFRRSSIEQSMVTNSELGELVFKYCPSCLSPIESGVEEGHCGLCRTDISHSQRHYSYIQMINEMNFQIRETKSLIGAYRDELDDIQSKLPDKLKLLDELKVEYSEITANADAIDAALTDVGSEIGFERGQIANLGEKEKMAEQIEGLVQKKSIENERILALKDKLTVLEEGTKNRYDTVYSSIEELAAQFIRADGGYEEVFKQPEEVSFDFGRDKMAVNGRSKFSASSMVIMKNSIRVAMFIQSVNDELVRLPRFFLMDNIEDKGMMESRSQNFQRVLVERCDEMENDYQLIFTTSMIDPDLNHSDYVVGPFYKKGEHTLVFSS